MGNFLVMMAVFGITLFLGFPIALCIGIGVSAALYMADISVGFVAQICFSGLDNYTYIAIPMFILAGFLMETGGLSIRLVNFASSLIGNIAGGLGIITVLACMFFAAISGSSPATVAAIGSMMIPSMVKKGYDPHFAGSFTACAGSMGILIPPSIPMIIYAVTAEVSIGEIFTAGSVIIILGFATAFARYLTMLQIPQMVGAWLLTITNNPTIILCMFVALIFFTGMFIETAAQILIYTPLFLPILTQLGVSPIHFGIILVIGTEIGLITPPVGVNLFVVQGITGSTIGQLTRNLMPFLVSILICQLLLVFFPKLVLFLPNLVYGK